MYWLINLLLLGHQSQIFIYIFFQGGKKKIPEQLELLQSEDEKVCFPVKEAPLNRF